MVGVARFDHLQNPTEGYRRSMYLNSSALLYTQTGEPWFTWGDIPVMKQHPTIRLGLRLMRSPLANVKLDKEKLQVPGKPEAALFVQDCFNRFWDRGIPRLMDSYHTWGRGVLGIDYRWDRKRKIIRIKKVRKIEPYDADPLEFDAGKRRGKFAGVNLRSNVRDRAMQRIPREYVFYFAGFAELDPYCDLPRLVGAVSPWKDQTMPGGANSSVRLFYWTRAVGATMVRYPHGKPLEMANGTRIDSQDVARMVGERRMNGMVAAVPNDKHPTMDGKYEWEIEELPASSDTAGVLDYKKSLATDMLTGMLIPEEVVQKEGGAYSGRALPMEMFLGGCDEESRMAWDEFREQHLERLMWLNYRVREFDCPLTSLLEEFRKQGQQGQQGQGGAGGPSDSPPTDPSKGPVPGQPYKGPKGGTGMTGPDGKVRYGKNLSGIPELDEPGGEVKYDKKTKQLHAAIALAMVEATLRKRMGADADGDSDELMRWLPELTDPAEAAQAMGAKMLGWTEYGTAKGSGKTRWKNDETGELRYQKSKPGEHSERREKGRGDAKKGSEIASKVLMGTHTREELQQLEHHLDKMTIPQLRSVRARLQAGFDNARQRDKMVDALKRHVQQRLLEPEGENAPEAPAAPRALTGAAAKNAKRADGTPANPEVKHVYTVDPKSIKVDPARFQYKVSGIKEGGVTDELKGTQTYNPELGGTLLAWRDPADGNDYVINGHHRHELATRTGAKSVNVRYIDAPTAKEARARGALANIAEGRGTATDAAKYLRDSGQDIEHLRRAGISMTGKVAADAAHLKDLSDKSFNDMTQGKIDEPTAVTVAKNLKDHDLQDKLFKLLDRRTEEGKGGWGPREIEAAAKKMSRAGRVTTTESTLFGDLDSEESTFEEEAEIEAAARTALNRTVNDFAAVSSAAHAGRVANAGNTLNTAENQRRRQEAAGHVEDFERESAYKSAVSDLIREHAGELKLAKPKDKPGVIKRAVEAVRGLIRGNATQAGSGGSGAGGTGAPGGDAVAAGGADRPDTTGGENLDDIKRRHDESWNRLNAMNVARMRNVGAPANVEKVGGRWLVKHPDSGVPFFTTNTRADAVRMADRFGKVPTREDVDEAREEWEGHRAKYEEATATATGGRSRLEEGLNAADPIAHDLRASLSPPPPPPARSALFATKEDVTKAAEVDPHEPANWPALAAAGKRQPLIEAATKLGLGDQAKKLPAGKILALLQAHKG